MSHNEINNMFLIPIDESYVDKSETIRDRRKLNFKLSKEKKDKVNTTISTKSNSPIEYNKTTSQMMQLNKFFYIESRLNLKTNDNKIKINDCLKEIWRCKAKNLRNLLANKYIRIVRTIPSSNNYKNVNNPELYNRTSIVNYFDIYRLEKISKIRNDKKFFYNFGECNVDRRIFNINSKIINQDNC